MPIFEIEQYETHSQRYRIEADTEAEAIARHFEGKAKLVEGAGILIEVNCDLGLPVDEFRDLADGLRDLRVSIDDDVIPSIRSIDRID